MPIKPVTKTRKPMILKPLSKGFACIYEARDFAQLALNDLHAPEPDVRCLDSRITNALSMLSVAIENLKKAQTVVKGLIK